MRKWILLFLLLPSIAFAGFAVDGVTDPAKVDGVAEPASVDGVASDYAVADYCASCDAVADADLFCEDFEGAETITNDGTCAVCASWTATETGEGVVTCAAHSGTLGCDDLGSFALNSYGSDDEAYIRRTWTDTNSFHTIFYFNFVTDNIDASGGDKTLVYFKLEGDASQRAILYLIKRQADNSLDSALDYVTGSTSHDTNMSAGTWYQIEISYTFANLSVWINDVLVHSVNPDDLDTDAAYYGLKDDGTATGNNTIQIDNIKADDDTLPTGCSGW